MSVEVGSKIAGRYTILELLARGGMGSVFVAQDEKFRERVALKVAAASGEVYQQFKARFGREARIGNRLGRSSGVVRAFDWGELDDGFRLYLAMDLVEKARPLDLSSGSLEERLARLYTASCIVGEAHEQGVVHRDLKPPNLLMNQRGHILLTDFGLAKVPGEEEVLQVEVTHTQMAMGTPRYMPPEQFEDAKHVDARADVYALGVMLYHALTGSYPYEGEATTVWRSQNLVLEGRRPPPRPQDVVPDTPDELDELCARALALNLDARLGSVHELCEGLRDFLGERVHPFRTGMALVSASGPVADSPTVVDPSPPEPPRDGGQDDADTGAQPAPASADSDTEPVAPLDPPSEVISDAPAPKPAPPVPVVEPTVAAGPAPQPKPSVIPLAAAILVFLIGAMMVLDVVVLKTRQVERLWARLKAGRAAPSDDVVGNERAALKTLEELRDAQIRYLEERGRYGELDDLFREHLIPEALASGESDGYRFELRVGRGGERWMATAAPLEEGKTGKRCFATSHEGWVYVSEHAFDLNRDCRMPVGAERITQSGVRSREDKVVSSLYSISTAQSLFREGDKERDGNFDYGSLAELTAADLIDPDLGQGSKHGYRFEVGYSPTTSEFLWYGVARPEPSRAGRSFLMTHEGVVYEVTEDVLQRFDRKECQVPPGASAVERW
jgi:serine/threonine protein kinase